MLLLSLCFKNVTLATVLQQIDRGPEEKEKTLFSVCQLTTFVKHPL